MQPKKQVLRIGAIGLGLVIIACPSEMCAYSEDDSKAQPTKQEPSDSRSVKEERAKRGNSALDWVEVLVPLVQSSVWPLVFFAALLVFRAHLARLLDMFVDRLKAAKVLGVELEINPVLNTRDFVVSTEKATGQKPVINGRPDMVELLCQVSSPTLKKSTKVMNMPGGCVVQVSTREISPNGGINLS